MTERLKTSDFDYQLPPELIAQEPAPQRDLSRLLVLHRNTKQIEHKVFRDLPSYLKQGDVLVLNNSRVIPARLRAINPSTNAKFEILLLEPREANCWSALVRPAKRAKPGLHLELLSPTSDINWKASVKILSELQGPARIIEFHAPVPVREVIYAYGEPPLPPYIKRSKTGASPSDLSRYQTVYAAVNGSVAAPTAGLHFTPELLEKISNLGVEIRFVTLHVGYGTFAPVKTDLVSEHKMHEEWYEIPPKTADSINAAKKEGRRIIAVGTTTVRVLETVAHSTGGNIIPTTGKTNLFIYPPFDFKIVDALITNFHLPRSTLLMLVSAFAAPNQISGRDLILKAYQQAIELRYRFYSYGDAMLIL